MQIDIRTQKFSLTKAIKSHTEHRISRALVRFSHHVQRVAVHLSDINGPRGGKDKCCLVKIKLSGMPDIVVKDVETNLYTSINKAVGRATRVALRELGKQRSFERQTHLLMG